MFTNCCIDVFTSSFGLLLDVAAENNKKLPENPIRFERDVKFLKTPSVIRIQKRSPRQDTWGIPLRL